MLVLKVSRCFLIEPKPMEPSKHQYDVDTETVIGFLKAHGLEKDFKVNIEVNHATLAGHTFEHELAVAVDNGMLGSIDANRGDYQNGWDTDQFPIDQYELVQAMMQIIRNGGLGNGGTNFDAKTRRNSTDLEDIFIAHIAGMDAMARALENAAALLNESPYKKMFAERYASSMPVKVKEFEEASWNWKSWLLMRKQTVSQNKLVENKNCTKRFWTCIVKNPYTMNNTNNGSKLYLYSITTVAILGGLLFEYDTTVISGAEKGLEAFFLMAPGFQYDKVMHGITSSSALIGCVLGCHVWCFRFTPGA